MKPAVVIDNGLVDVAAVQEEKSASWLPRGTAGFALYTLLLLGLALALPPVTWQGEGVDRFVIIVGSIALWRYTWGLVHYVRSQIYARIVFPKWRRDADVYGDSLMPSHIYFLVTAFRIEADTTLDVFRATIREAISCGVPATVVMSIVELGDEFLAKQVFASFNPPPHVALDIVRIPGTGKRDGLGQGFRAISRLLPPPGAVVAVVDGDSVMEEGLTRKCAVFFKMNPKLGALTTDEECEVRGSRIMREWHDLRFAQRQILMCSMGLSRKVLTLTGRMSMFRADIITNPEFIKDVEADAITHWRLGRFRFLTGDDKSSWYYVLRQGWQMMYVPDTVVYTVEHPPSDNFFKASTQLMYRWFGNMLRTNGRAIVLGPWTTGLFTWWCLLDQRISMWTSLTGPVFCLLLIFKHGILYLPVYLVWIGFTRWIMSLMLLASRPHLSWYYPFLIYYNQIYGSLIKTYVFFRLNRQSWTRQKTKLDLGVSKWQDSFMQFSSTALHMTSLICFVAVVGVLTGVFTVPTYLVWIVTGIQL